MQTLDKYMLKSEQWWWWWYFGSVAFHAKLHRRERIPCMSVSKAGSVRLLIKLSPSVLKCRLIGDNRRVCDGNGITMGYLYFPCLPMHNIYLDLYIRNFVWLFKRLSILLFRGWWCCMRSASNKNMITFYFVVNVVKKRPEIHDESLNTSFKRTDSDVNCSIFLSDDTAVSRSK